MVGGGGGGGSSGSGDKITRKVGSGDKMPYGPDAKDLRVAEAVYSEKKGTGSKHFTKATIQSLLSIQFDLLEPQFSYLSGNLGVYFF